MDRAEATRTMAAPAADVRAVFWDIAAWYRVWDRITEVAVGYDDGAHQEFAMAVERDGRTERVRTVRFLGEGGDIGFFSPAPPPSMGLHRGAWRFDGQAQPGRCTVTAVRDYELLRGDGEDEASYTARRTAYRERFETRLGRILDCFADHFAESFADHSADRFADHSADRFTNGGHHP